MSKSILQNFPDALSILNLETEERAAYLLEHLHASGGNPLSEGNSLPANLANTLSPRYYPHQEKISKGIVAACYWLINHGYLDVINVQGFYEISSKGNNVKTAAEFKVQRQRSDGSLAEQTVEDSGAARKSKYSFPKIELSESQLMWLRIITNQFLRGYLADVDRIKKSLHAQGKWPRNFQPSEIDYRLYQRDNIPTLLGIWHADPQSEWLAKCDELIGYIKTKLPVVTKIKVAEIAEAIGITQLNASILIHLLPSLGLYYTAVGLPVRSNTVVIPGQLGTYDILQLDDPEKMDGYLEYANLEEQIRKVYGADEDRERESTTEENLTPADRLYDKVKALIEKPESLSEDSARLIVESADDALKEFGSTNQEKKVLLRIWKAQAESFLPPATVEELRKRAEGGVLKKLWPRSATLQKGLVGFVALLIVLLAVTALKKTVFDFDDANPKGPTQTAISSPLPTVASSPMAVDSTDNALSHSQKPASIQDQIEPLCIRYEESKSAYSGDVTIGMGGISYEGSPLRHLVNFTVHSPGQKAVKYFHKENGDKLIYKGRGVFEITVLSTDTFSACFDVRKKVN